MRQQILGLRVAGSVIGLMSLAQLGRLVVRPVILVDGHVMPLWPSAIAFVLLLFLSVWLWKLGGRPPKV